MTKKSLIVLFVIGAVLISGCGSTAGYHAVATGHGFWRGIWDGATVWFAFLGNALGIGHWNIYSVHNDGWPYNLGFLLAVGGSSGSLGESARSAARHRR